MLKRNNVTIEGDGATTLVFSHGFGSDQSVWGQVADWAVKKYRVVRFDLMGSGMTKPGDFDRARYDSLQGYADDLLTILQKTGTERCIYVGHSVSGMIGLLAGIARPHLFERMILLAASPRYLNDGDYVGGFEKEDLTNLFDAINANFREWATNFAPHVIGADIDDPLVKDFASGMLRMQPDIALTMALMIFTSDLREELPKLEVPSLILQSRNDIAVPMAVAHYLHARLSNSQLGVIEADGHLPHITAPHLVIAAIERYLEETLR